MEAISNDEPANISSFLNEQYNLTTSCTNCNRTLSPYKYNRTENTYFMSLANIQKVTYHLKYCSECDIIIYPDLSQYKNHKRSYESIVHLQFLLFCIKSD